MSPKHRHPGQPLAQLLLLLVMLLLSGCKTQLYAGLPEREANEVTGLLLEQGIRAEKTEGEEHSWRVMIDEDDFAQAVAVLRQAQFPAHANQGLGEVFKKDGLVSSPVEERARLIHALSQELGNTLSRIEGVLEARVHVMIPPPELLSERRRPASASVFIKHRQDVDLASQVPQIKALVLHAVEDARYETVSVALFSVEASPWALSRAAASSQPMAAPASSSGPSAWWLLLLPLCGLAGYALRGVRARTTQGSDHA